jgi:uncharacterized cupredoxin-like copper-binding protein
MLGRVGKGALFAATAAVVLAIAPGQLMAHGDASAGEPGQDGKVARTIEIVASETADGMRFTPDRVEARRGEQIRFTIRNVGGLEHEFVVGTPEANQEHAKMMAAMPDMKHSDANAVTVAPGASGSLVWRFTHKGDFEFACLIVGHYEAGMHGTVAVR